MRLPGGTAVAVLASMALAACGGGDSGNGGSSGGSYGTPAEKVASTFKAATGVTLTKLDDDETWVMYVPPPADAAAQEKFGPISIYVFKQPGKEDVLLNGATADASGIYWKSAGANLWNGTKRYGENVYVVYAGLPSKQPDAHVKAVDAALQGL
jgi:hypothetical protein